MRDASAPHGDTIEWVPNQRLRLIQTAVFGTILVIAIALQSDAGAAGVKLSPRNIEVLQLRGEGWLKSASAECMVEIADYHRLDLSARNGADLLSFTAGLLLSAMDAADKRVALSEGAEGDELQKALAEKERLRRDRVQRYPSCTFANADRAEPEIRAPAGAISPQP